MDLDDTDKHIHEPIKLYTQKLFDLNNKKKQDQRHGTAD